MISPRVGDKIGSSEISTRELRAGQTQIPFGNDRQKDRSNGKNEMRGVLAALRMTGCGG